MIQLDNLHLKSRNKKNHQLLGYLLWVYQIKVLLMSLVYSLILINYLQIHFISRDSEKKRLIIVSNKNIT